MALEFFILTTQFAFGHGGGDHASYVSRLNARTQFARQFSNESNQTFAAVPVLRVCNPRPTCRHRLAAKNRRQKAIVPLAITNNLAVKVESARALCFLLDEQGKMIGQSAKWVVGGTKDRPALPSKAGTTYNFVITSPHPFTTTNLTIRVVFTQLILAGGQAANPNNYVAIEQSQKKLIA